jgi:6-phosphogluconolactonase
MLVMSFLNLNAQQMFVGTYTKKEGHVDGKGEGVYLVDFNEKTGEISNSRIVAKMTNPSFIKFSAEEDNLYAVSELGGGDAQSGFIHSFAVEGNKLRELGKISTEAFAPCHIETDKTGNYIFVSNYVGGVVMLYKRDAQGKLEKKQKIVLENPENSHPHSVSISSDNKTAYIADLGNDRIWLFKFDAKEGKLLPHSQEYISLEEGAGPRHFTFSSDEKFAYSINELNSSISIFKIEEDGALKHLRNVSTLPKDFSGKNSTADIHLHPSGGFLYASNRGIIASWLLSLKIQEKI